MDNWYLKTLGDGVAAFGPTNQIQEAFLALAKAKAAAGQDYSDISVFQHHDLRQNSVTVYFSPKAELLAKAFKAEPCEKPTPSEIFALLVGDSDNWKTHFPGYLESRS
ncbi:hypothetical protein [uncultured Lamprocystis sp.]|uniref:hypothetical protein n=1 Tax=uncultured Lamprocystis sp. TaxID=543132 RepID=UPI0025F08BCA|nr:hypothetical protein [uncultured Lamprocystis sp.]